MSERRGADDFRLIGTDWATLTERGVAPEMLAPDAELMAPCGGFWVFAYGSLMWKPGFAYAERRAARAVGFARRFCLSSRHYRGTPEAPGLVLGLDAEDGAATRGVAYRVPPEEAGRARDYLLDREMISSAYYEATPEVELLCGEATRVRALAYVVNRGHPQYAADLSLEEQAAVIERSRGPWGPNCEYLFNTVAHLRAEGLGEAELDGLERLERLVLERRAARRDAAPPERTAPAQTKT